MDRMNMAEKMDFGVICPDNLSDERRSSKWISLSRRIMLFRYEVFSEVRVSWVQDKMGGVAEGSANILKQCQ